MNTPIMTLEEYQSQTDPVYKPIVRLQENEYNVIDTYTYKGEARKLINIKAYPMYRYIKRGNDNQLFALKDDGNCDTHSCFWLTE